MEHSLRNWRDYVREVPTRTGEELHAGLVEHKTGRVSRRDIGG